jgi:ABC-type phosphate/phosphonate transport system substrate-binding protein/rhodanese-related sulfurtransferase
MRWMIAGLLAWLTLFSCVTRAADALVLNVTLDYDQERDHVATQSVFNDLAKALSASLKQPVKLVMTQNAERVGERIRTGSYTMLLAPAQLIGLAMRNGYTPVARTEEDANVVLIASKQSGIGDFSNARGKRIALPHAESLVTYMVNGEMNAMGLSPTSFFGQITNMNQYGAVLFAMDIGQADLAAVKESIAKQWLARNAGGKLIKTLPAVPQAGVVVNDKLNAGLKDRIRLAFTQLDPALQTRLKRAHFGTFEPADTADFEFVSTRGFFTPEVLPGGNIATAEQVKKLMAQGAPLFDVRPAAHRRSGGFIPGSISLPYALNSPKDVDAEDSVDRFDLSKLPKNKNTPIIFQCNGAECWFSYKASRYAIKRGYTKVYWFRTGLPAWQASGYPVQDGK